MPSSSRPWLQIHFCVLLWGFTAIIGKLVSLSALTLVWWRMALVAGTLFCLTRFWKGFGAMPPRLRATYAGIGILVALHWLTFYGAIKLSNASVATTCLALTPVFIAFVEPLLGSRNFDICNVILGLAVVPGVALVVGGTPADMRLGILVGISSSLLVAVLSSLNTRFAGEGDALSITGIEMAAGVAFLTMVGPVLPHQGSLLTVPGLYDASLLLLLAFGCTLLPFALSLIAMRKLSAFAVALALNMEPVYAIVLAILILGEQHQLHAAFYLGVTIIVLVVFSHPWIAAQRARPPAASNSGTAGHQGKTSN